MRNRCISVNTCTSMPDMKRRPAGEAKTAMINNNGGSSAAINRGGNVFVASKKPVHERMPCSIIHGNKTNNNLFAPVARMNIVIA